MTEIHEIFDLYDSMERKNIMLSFKGEISTELLTSILQIIENKLDRFGESSKVKKRMFNIMVECLQNLHHHISQPAMDAGKEMPSVIVMVAKNVTGYSIITGNFVEESEVGELKGRLEEINSMSKDEVKELYKSVLADGKMSEKGGGGLGMIDIARKSGEKLDFGFIPFGEDKTFFSLNVKVK
ncbi:SiaB family protein kinase [Cryomorphaceae bacterium 1068]|nr:SiaB family protein kinase [Cryomorphaceae bacterium 1068]